MLFKYWSNNPINLFQRKIPRLFFCAWISSGAGLPPALHAVSLERRLAGCDLQQRCTSSLCPLFTERCLGLAYVNEGWEDDGEKWSGQERVGGCEEVDERMEGDVLNDREVRSLYTTANILKNTRGTYSSTSRNTCSRLLSSLTLPRRDSLCFPISTFNLCPNHTRFPNTHTHTHKRQDKRMNHPLRLLIKTIIEQQRQQAKRKGRGGAAACYQILRIPQRVAPTTSSAKYSSASTWVWTWNKHAT